MVNDAAKYSLGVAGFGVIAAIAYRAAHGDRAGSLLLAAVAVGAAVLAFGSGRVLGSDAAPFVAPDAQPVATPVDPDELPARSVAPLVAAVGTTIAVAGGAIGPELVVEGLVVAAVGLMGWLALAWRRTPTFSERDAANLDDRLLGPLALPVVGFIVTALVAISFSRVLLAVSETASWVIAFIVASVVLAVLWTLAHRRPDPRLGAGLAAAGMAIVLIAGGAGASAGPREFHRHGESELSVAELTAKNVAFTRADIELPANQDAEIVFTNFDVGTNHNVAVYTADDPGTPVFNGRPILKGTITYSVRTPAVGVYRYVCDFHPTMTGTLKVVAAEKAETGTEHGEMEH